MCAISQKFACRIYAERQLMLNWREGEHAPIGANERIGRDAFLLRERLHVDPLCKMPEHMRIKAHCCFLVLRVRWVRVGLCGKRLLESLSLIHI